MEAITNLWNGRSGLAAAYWGWGVLGSLVWGVALAFVTPGSAIAMLAVLVFFAYIVAVHVGIWRAATQYEGARVWAGLAKAAVMLTPACIIVGVLAAVIIPATNKPQGQVSQPAPQRMTDPAPKAIDWEKGAMTHPQNTPPEKRSFSYEEAFPKK